MDRLEYYVSLIPNHGLKISINVEFKIASDKLPFIERLKETIEKNYNVPGNPASNGDLDLEEIGWVVNDETEDVVTINGESGMTMTMLMIIMIIIMIMPARQRWQLLNNNIIKLRKILRKRRFFNLSK